MAGALHRDRVCSGDVVGVCVEVSTSDTTCFGWRHMRRWLCRGLWLLAWSFWVWLGVGLYRELPRDIGRRREERCDGSLLLGREDRLLGLRRPGGQRRGAQRLHAER